MAQCPKRSAGLEGGAGFIQPYLLTCCFGVQSILERHRPSEYLVSMGTHRQAGLACRADGGLEPGLWQREQEHRETCCGSDILTPIHRE